MQLVSSMYPCQDVPVLVFRQRCTHPCLYCGLYKYQFPEDKIITSGRDNIVREMSKYKGAYFSPVTDCFLPENCELTHYLLEETWKMSPRWVPLVNTKQMIPEKTIELFARKSHELVLQISIPSSDEELVSILEPGSAFVSKRLGMIKELTTAGIPVIVTIMPWFDFGKPEELAKKLSNAGVKRTLILNGILTETQRKRMINSVNMQIKSVAESVCFVKEATENGYVLSRERRIKSLTQLIDTLTRFGILARVCICDNHDLGDTKLPLCGKFKHHNFEN